MLERWRPGAWWKLPRGMCRQRAGCNPGAAKADGQAWWKLPRRKLEGFRGFRGLKPGKRQARAVCRQRATPDKLRNHCPNMGAPYGYRICLLSAVQQLAHLKPARKALHRWSRRRRLRVFGARTEGKDYGNAGRAALALKDKTFRRKTYLPKAYNFHVQMPGSLNWRMTHARRRFTRCGLTLES